MPDRISGEAIGVQQAPSGETDKGPAPAWEGRQGDQTITTPEDCDVGVKDRSTSRAETTMLLSPRRRLLGALKPWWD